MPKSATLFGRMKQDFLSSRTQVRPIRVISKQTTESSIGDPANKWRYSDGSLRLFGFCAEELDLTIVPKQT